MKIKELSKLIENLDPEMDVYLSDPDSCNIIYGFSSGDVVTVEELREFAWDEWNSCDFPVGYTFLNLD